MLKIIAIVVALFGAAAPAAGQTMDHGNGHNMNKAGTPPLALPTETGQSAFAAIQEIVAKLSADPATDWSKVDIAGLRRHLVDMDELTRNASAEAVMIENGLRIKVTGTGRTLRAIQAMVPAHSAELDRIDNWSAQGEATADGATLTVTSRNPADLPKIRALGFFGLMATGAHHQGHHWAMATGQPVHRH